MLAWRRECERDYVRMPKQHFAVFKALWWRVLPSDLHRTWHMTDKDPSVLDDYSVQCT